MTATPTIARLDAKAIGDLLGKDAVANLTAKTRGGQSGFKGFRYEDLFGVHRIARLSKKLIQEGKDAFVEWQSAAFVDDFVVRRDEERSFKGYQLKNALNVSWATGAPSIAADFERQYAVCAAEGYTDIRLRLVCSNGETVTALTNSTPEPIAAYSRSFWFPYTEKLLQLLNEHDWMTEDFAYLSRSETPTRMEVNQVVGILVGAWALKAPRALVSEVIAQARDVSPTLLRSVKPDTEAASALSDEARAILGDIADFRYAIMRGFLHWSALGDSTKGVLSFDCFTEKFQVWQRHLVQRRPRTFQELEGTLI